MDELISREINQGIEQLTPATVAMSLTMNLQESARIMDDGLGRHQHVNAEVCMVVLLWMHTSLSSPINPLLQLTALLCPIHRMGELISEETDLETEQDTPATVAMSSLVSLQESVKIMESGREMHQLVKVSLLYHSCI